MGSTADAAGVWASCACGMPLLLPARGWRARCCSYGVGREVLATCRVGAVQPLCLQGAYSVPLETFCQLKHHVRPHALCVSCCSHPAQPHPQVQGRHHRRLTAAHTAATKQVWGAAVCLSALMWRGVMGFVAPQPLHAAAVPAKNMLPTSQPCCVSVWVPACPRAGAFIRCLCCCVCCWPTACQASSSALLHVALTLFSRLLSIYLPCLLSD